MNTNFRQIIEMPELAQVLNVKNLNTGLNLKQKKAVKNIKECADYQWGYVNSWLDCESEDCRNYILNAKEVFNKVYKDSLEEVYEDGDCWFDESAKKFLKDVRFCGKKFLQAVALYYTAKLLEEAVKEVDGTDTDIQKVARDLKAIKESI